MNIEINTSPDYRQIYEDILNKKFPHKKEDCATILNKGQLSVLDIIKLNKTIFGVPDKETETDNQRHRSYSRDDIFKILDYQKKHRLNNIQLANHFNLSKNTVAKWKKMFLV